MTITILLTYEFKIKQKRLSKMSSIGNVSSLCTGKVQTTFFKLTNGILKTEMWTKDKTKRLSKKQVGIGNCRSKRQFVYVQVQIQAKEDQPNIVRDDEHVSFWRQRPRTRRYYINYIFRRCGGGSGLVADKKEMNFLTLFQTQCAHWY